jgi:hypothetical protein
MEDGKILAEPRRRSPVVALVSMATVAFERRSGRASLPLGAAACGDRPPSERTVTLRRGGFGVLGDSLSLDDKI